MNASALVSATAEAIKRHTPGILTGLGIFGMATSVGLAVWQAPKAHILLEEKRKAKEAAGEEPKLTIIETTKTVWKQYLPCALTFAVSTALLIASGHISGVRTATMATALGLSETAFQQYKAQVVKTLGEKKEAQVQDDVAREQLRQHPVSNTEVILTGKGEHLCYDPMSGRYFKSDIEKVRSAINEINRRLLGDVYISVNEFYELLGLKPIELGDDLGWNVDKGYLDVHFTSDLADDGTPCLVLNYSVLPVNGYNKLF